MIKIQNQKSIKEINELKEKGLYQAPFSLLANMDLENVNVTKDTFDDSELQARLDEMELTFDEISMSLYETMARMEATMSESILEVYETMMEVE